MQTSDQFHDWAAVSPALADVLPHTDASSLSDHGRDFDAGVALIAASQELTHAEAEEIVRHRLLLARRVSYQLAAE